MKKSEVMKSGHWPDFFLKDLLSPIPSTTISGDIKLTWNCSLHGPYEQSIKSHLRGNGCPHCKSNNAHKSRRANNPYPQWFIDELSKSEAGRKILAQELPLRTKIEFICPLHGPYFQNAERYWKGLTGCSLCKGQKIGKAEQKTKRLSNPYPQWFIDELSLECKDKVLKGEISVNDEATFICPKHGEYRQIIYSHINAVEGTKKCGCPSCAAEASIYGSKYEIKLRESLETLGIRVQKVRGKIQSPWSGFPMELDLFLPDYNLAIEVDGLYYHTMEYLNESHSKIEGMKYHQVKTDLCAKEGIQLIHLFEDDLRDRYEVCLNLIKSKLGLLHHKRVYARQCEVKEVASEMAHKFYDKYHIQGWGQGICYGLYYKGHLMSCMSMRKACSNTKEKGSWELNRYASINNYFVVGGFERLEKFFIQKFSIKRLISFADKTISNGALYYKQGYKLESVSGPDYQYVYKGKRWHKFNFRIKRFKEDPDLLYEEGLTELQLAQLNKITRIYDCGKMKFVKEFI
nr:MAG TPA: endonuclease-like protein [Bacteriophage sp.]